MKLVAGNIYVHKDQLDGLDPMVKEAVREALQLTPITDWSDFDLVRYTDKLDEFSFLSYSSFLEDAFPRLLKSHKVQLSKRSVSFRDYRDSSNPPILHRKELFSVFDSELLEKWSALTLALEEVGAFDEPLKIGFQNQWVKTLHAKGFYVDGHHLLPLANQDSLVDRITLIESNGSMVQRHLTALTRYALSAPVQQLIRCGLLMKESSFFDYGCGRGDDLRALLDNGYQAGGWDPHFANEQVIYEADVVNLGFVLNVIEDPLERSLALKKALKLAQKVLSVGVMVANENNVSGTPYADGVLTSRQTFQKYFSQQEFIDYLFAQTGLMPFPVAPGICLLFKDEDVEQRFLLGRQTSRSVVAEGFHYRREQRIRERVPRPRAVKQSIFEANRELLDELWEQTLILGREPMPEELLNLSQLIDVFGSLKRAFKLNWNNQNATEFELASKQRLEDLTVYFAMEKFRQQRPYKDQPTRLKTDVKYFFGSLRSAQDAGFSLLKSVPDLKSLWEDAKRGAECGVGFFDESTDQYFIPADKLSFQQPIVRACVGCAAALYGDAASSSLIKVHIRSSKVTFLTYDDFYGKPIPLLVQRVKINLKTLRMDVFTYDGPFTPIPLLEKSRFLSEGDQGFLEQFNFDIRLREEGFFEHEFDVLSFETIQKFLHDACLQISGFDLLLVDKAPDVGAPCGRYLMFRDFFLCGETQAKFQIFNLPKQVETYRAYYLLAKNVLDPLIDYFGPIKLTYGFCGSKLRPLIKKRVSHDRDQHASFEKKRNGEFVCSRGGAACDFIVEHEDMYEVAEWVAGNTPVDRLYFHGSDRPIHISYKLVPDGEFYQVEESDSGKQLTKKLIFS
ncbi:Peptidase M15A [Limnobacter sp. 130]|uniref:DNA phosphorothioation-associated putative methyltransferase n=1 Tax=Limnobacter sp. 130 TaxID=2653147 RepID=UPI0012F453B9|nr:DNA phosphorothioation-associated putative methyltransferase [Limnobacter sp. 130]VWX37420.1 Peptidase M15A [Limnobacter sp. 130]